MKRLSLLCNAVLVARGLRIAPPPMAAASHGLRLRGGLSQTLSSLSMSTAAAPAPAPTEKFRKDMYQTNTCAKMLNVMKDWGVTQLLVWRECADEAVCCSEKDEAVCCTT